MLSPKASKIRQGLGPWVSGQVDLRMRWDEEGSLRRQSLSSTLSLVDGAGTLSSWQLQGRSQRTIKTT